MRLFIVILSSSLPGACGSQMAEPPVEPRPELGLAVEPRSVRLVPGTVAEVDLTIRRDGFDGELDVTVAGLPTGVIVPLEAIPDGRRGAGLDFVVTDAIERHRGSTTVTISVFSGPSSASTDLELQFPGPSGAADRRFGGDGIVVLSPPSGEPGPGSLAIDSQGRLVVAGVVETTRLVGWMMRVLPDGELDPSFGNGGLVTLPGNSVLQDVVTLVDDSLVVQGFRDSGGQILDHYFENGSLDQAFRNATAGPLFDSIAGGFGLYREGDTLVYADAGVVRRFDLDGQEDVEARYRPDTGGITAIGPDGAGGTYVAILAPLDIEGAAIDRIDATGDLDLGFGVDGRLTIPELRNGGGVHRFVVPDDRGAVALGIVPREGARGEEGALFRFDGAEVDSGFGGDGLVEVIYGASRAAPPLLVEARGQLLVAGGPWKESAPSILRRFESGGILDTSFGLTAMADLPAMPVDMVVDEKRGRVIVLAFDRYERQLFLASYEL